MYIYIYMHICIYVYLSPRGIPAEAFTFVAVPSAIHHAHAKPVFRGSKRVIMITTIMMITIMIMMIMTITIMMKHMILIMINIIMIIIIMIVVLAIVIVLVIVIITWPSTTRTPSRSSGGANDYNIISVL